ncbi:hypothetical protein L211DRAFT_848710 [Terfezia boudieri ATCC MYA-4762]|uniref:Uncharacterized protein n=1 Tax=Terfezia boudieri ATCC MYA-4762 TaxID=1051890 RepID=A0A3N4LPR4_9PEZI|nr:hypothetical protein L211DRAFT_848710 [Terfezia boudieri ATCC MYA-4762]
MVAARNVESLPIGVSKATGEVKEWGNLYAEERKKDGDLPKWKKWKDKPPQKPIYSDGHRITQCVIELSTTIAKHSAAKLHRRIVKRCTDFSREPFRYTESNITRPEEEDDRHKQKTQFFENLLQIVGYIIEIHGALDEESGELKLEAIKLMCIGWSAFWKYFVELQAAHEHEIIPICSKTLTQKYLSANALPRESTLELWLR